MSSRQSQGVRLFLVLSILALLVSCGGGGGGGGSESLSSKEWKHPSGLSDNITLDEHAGTPQVAMDEDGNAVIVWVQDDGSSWQVFKSEYRSGAWTHPASLSDNISPDGQDAYGSQVAMDGNGNAVIVWQQSSDGANDQIFKSEYRSGAWTHPASLVDNISPDGQYSRDPQVAMGDDGNAVIVWQQFDVGDKFQVFKSEYRNGAWTHPSGLNDNISPDGQDAWGPRVAMDDSGNVVIVWQQRSDGTYYQVFKSEYRNGAWTHPATLSDNINPDGQYAGGPRVAMDGSGNTVIVWQQYDGSRYRILKSEYRNGTWTHPSGLDDSISPDGQSAEDPRVAMSDSGNALIVWRQSGVANEQVFKSEYRNGAWTQPASVNGNISPGGQVYDIQAAMDDDGNALVVWKQSDGADYQVFKSEYRSGAWTQPASVNDNISPDGWDAEYPGVAMDGSGNAVIVWRQVDGSYWQIFMSEYRLW